MGDGWQLVLVDLPGFQKPFDRLTERMQRAVDDALADADAVVLMLDGPEGSAAGDRYIASRALRAGAPPCLIAMNKVDRMRPAAIAEAIVAADAARRVPSPSTRSARSPATVSTRCCPTWWRCFRQGRPTSRPA